MLLAYTAIPLLPTKIVPRFDIVVFSPYIPIVALSAVEFPTSTIPLAVLVTLASAFAPAALLLYAYIPIVPAPSKTT